MKQITDFVRGLALGVAVGLLLSSAIPARADTKIELGTGLTLYGHHGDGVWHQRDYGPYDIKDRAANLSVGLTGDVFGWRSHSSRLDYPSHSAGFSSGGISCWDDLAESVDGYAVRAADALLRRSGRCGG